MSAKHDFNKISAHKGTPPRNPAPRKNQRKNQPQKKEVKLVISDMDNTFTDTIKAWTHATDRALNRFATVRGVSVDELDKAIRKMPDEFRYGDITQMLNALSALPQFNGRTSKEAERLAVADHEIRSEWYRSQAENTHFYTGVVETLRKLKQTGAKFVVYTDSREHTCIRRLYNLARNHRKIDPSFKGGDELLDLIDAIYVQPRGNTPGPSPQSLDEYDFGQKLRKKMVVLPPNSSKPNPANMRRILRDYDMEAKDAIMLGDTSLDGGSARPAGVDFVWVPYGAQVMEKSLKLFDRIGPKHWYIGYDYVKGTFDKHSKPNYKFYKGLHELFEQFTFPPKTPDNDNAPAQKKRAQKKLRTPKPAP